MPVKLTKTQYNDLLTSERTLSQQLTEMDKAEQCGIDCQQLRSAVQTTLEEIQQLKTNFGPKSK